MTVMNKAKKKFMHLSTEMTMYSEFYPHDEDKPRNPIKDILTFEKQIKKRYTLESKRRVMYSVILVKTIIAYVLYVTQKVADVVRNNKDVDDKEVGVLLVEVYIKIVGTVICVFYAFLVMMRRSSKVTNTLSNQLRLLNVSFMNEKIKLCQIKTPDKIKKSLKLFREEEQKRRLQWMKKE